MTLFTTKTIEIARFKKPKVHINFNGDKITSDAGVLPVKQADKMTGLTKCIAINWYAPSKNIRD